MDNTFFERKEAILNALIDRKGIQHLTDAASRVLGNPMLLYDMSGIVLATSQCPGDEEIWDQLLHEGNLITEYTRTVEKAGIFEQLVSCDAPVISKLPFSSYRMMGCRVRDKDGPIGIVGVVERTPFGSDDEDLLVIVCKSILFEMLYSERTAMQSVPYFSIFKDIIEKASTEQDIIERCRVSGLSFPKSMQLIAVKSADLRSSLSLYLMRDTLTNTLPASAFCIIYDDSLISVVDKKYVTRDLIKSIQAVVGGSDTRIGISRPFDDIMNLSDAFGEMLAIQRVYQKLEVDSLIIYYEDILLYHFMELASHGADLERF